MLKSSAPIPQPSAAIMVLISSLPSILSKRAFSTFRILPLSGRMAWKRRSRPCLADPPADSPSTIYNSHRAGSRSWQSASLPGSVLLSSAPLRRTRSRALRAASRARAASMTLLMMRLATDGCSSRKAPSLSLTIASTMPLTSVLPSFVLVCPSDCGRRLPARMAIDRNAAAVVDDGHRAVDVKRGVDLVAEAGERFVDRVVDDFVHQMVKTRRPRRADVHRRPLANRVEPFENLDFVG